MRRKVNVRRAAWHAQFQDLLAHLADGGRMPYPRPGQLPHVERSGQWVLKQRRLAAAERLPEDLVAELAQVPGLLVSKQFLAQARTASSVDGVDVGAAALEAELTEVRGELTKVRGELRRAQDNLAKHRLAWAEVEALLRRIKGDRTGPGGVDA